MTFKLNAPIIGISGYARSGKTTFAKAFAAFLGANGHHPHIVAMADELKSKIDPFLLDVAGISAWTEDDREKKLIRPMLVAYGTHLMRNIDENYWIKILINKSQNMIENNHPILIPDIRYKNEMEFVKNSGGFCIYIKKDGVLPPNEEEKSNNDFLIKNADVIFDNESMADFSHDNFISSKNELFKSIYELKRSHFKN